MTSFPFATVSHYPRSSLTSSFYHPGGIYRLKMWHFLLIHLGLSHHRDGRQKRGGAPGGEPRLSVVLLFLLLIGLLPEPVDDAQLLATLPAAVGLVDELASAAAASEAASVVAEVSDNINSSWVNDIWKYICITRSMFYKRQPIRGTF